jgi:hypothetical protein
VNGAESTVMLPAVVLTTSEVVGATSTVKLAPEATRPSAVVSPITVAAAVIEPSAAMPLACACVSVGAVERVSTVVGTVIAPP